MNVLDDAGSLARLGEMRERAVRHEIPGPGGGTVWHEWGEGAPVVLLHGGSGSWTHWVENIDFLAARRRVIAGDLPGCGDSASPPEPYDGPALGAIVADALDGILTDEQVYDVVGFSFGGIVGGNMAPLRSDRVRSLTLIGSPLFGLPSTGRANELVAVDPKLDLEDARALHRQNLMTMMLADESRVDALALRLHHDNLRRARLRSRKIARSDGLAVALEKVTCPVHGIWGEHDVTVEPDMDALRKGIIGTAPGSTFDVLPGAGHWVSYEQPDAFNRLLATRLGFEKVGG